MTYYLVSDRYGPIRIIENIEQDRELVKQDFQYTFHKVNWFRAWMLKRRINSIQRDSSKEISTLVDSGKSSP